MKNELEDLEIKDKKYLLSLAPQLHKQLKVYSAKTGKDMGLVIIEAIKEFIKK